MPYIEIDGDEATGQVNFHAMLVARSAEKYTMPRWAVGHYKVRYRRTPDGWRMSERLEKPFIQSQTEQWGY